jgi:POT family proton-dependent oligopeptide transporter
MASLIMGTWFFASATGNFSAGLIAAATGAEGAGPDRVTEVYNVVGWFGVAVGVGVVVVSPLIKKLMHLDTLRDDVDHTMAGEQEIGEPAAAGVNTGGETR